MQVTQKLDLKPAAPIFRLEMPNQAVPVGKTVRASINNVTSGKGAGENQYAVSMGTEWTSSHQHQPHT